MQTIEGIFDSEESPDAEEELRSLTAQTDAFDLWQDEREDIFQDYVLTN